MVRKSSTSNSIRSSKRSSGANLGFEEKLWQAADRLRGHMDPAEYKHVALGLIFLKYISDAFEERYQQLTQWASDPSSDYYIKEPKERYEVLYHAFEEASLIRLRWQVRAITIADQEQKCAQRFYLSYTSAKGEGDRY